MKYGEIVHGVFIERPNRFIAMVDVNGVVEKCHVKNTGRCKELLIPGAKVLLEHFNSPNRKTAYDLVSVYKGEMLVNIDSQAPNKIALESLEQIIGKYDYVKPEYTIGDSRIDIYAESNGKKYLIEVKGVTLETDGHCRFPDAPTERGIKHIRELRKAKAEGYDAYVLFIVQMAGMKVFSPNYQTHLQFGIELEQAVDDGVGVLVYGCDVSEGVVTLGKSIPYTFEDHQ